MGKTKSSRRLPYQGLGHFDLPGFGLGEDQPPSSFSDRSKTNSISSRHGHLSNTQTAELVKDLLAHGLETVVLGHLSRDCNCPDLAAAVMRASASGGQLDGRVASQDTPTCWVEIMEEEAPGT